MVPSGDHMPKTNIARSLTRLKSVLATLYRDSSKDNMGGGSFGLLRSYGTSTTMFKECNSFMHPGLGYEIANSRWEPKFIMSVGSKLNPENPIRSNAEFVYQLKKTL